MPLLSIIIPIYNTENYLRKCLGSVQKQSFADYECIMVDDCSRDNSCLICKEYESKDNRFIYIRHSINLGQSAARNTGLDISSGKYIIFLDSDDYFFDDALNPIVSKIREFNDLDILQTKYARVTDNGNIIEKYPLSSRLFCNHVVSGNEFFKEAISNGSFRVMVWSYIFNAEFLSKYNLYFKNGMTQEDDVFTTACLIRASRVGFLDVVTYAYVDRDNSTMSPSKQKANSIDLLKACSFIVEDSENITDPITKKLVMNQVVENMITSFFWGKYTKKDDFKSHFDISFMKKNSYLKKTKRKVFILQLNRNLCFHLISASQRKKTNNGK